MPWLVIISCYFLGSIPTAYIAGRLMKGEDIRLMGDGNMGGPYASAHAEAGGGTAESSVLTLSQMIFAISSFGWVASITNQRSGSAAASFK